MIRLAIEPHDPPAQRPIAKAVECLQKKAVVAYPTDTLYALGCAIDSRKGVETLYRLRGMKKQHRLALICPDITTASQFGHLSQTAFRLCQRVFPGPFTIVVPATREVPRLLLDKRQRTVGLRIVDHPVTKALVTQLGAPLLTTSAITADGELCIDADDVAEHFGSGIDVLIDSGPTPGEPSTVVKVADGAIEIVRQGLGTLDEV